MMALAELLNNWADLEPERCRKEGLAFRVNTATTRTSTWEPFNRFPYWETVWMVENSFSNDVASVQFAVQESIAEKPNWTCELSLIRRRQTLSPFWTAKVWTSSIPFCSKEQALPAIALLEAYLAALEVLNDANE